MTEPGGKREMYWNHEDESAVWQGKAYVEGDEICDVYEQRPDARCSEVYQLDDGSFEVWRNGCTTSTARPL